MRSPVTCASSGGARDAHALLCGIHVSAICAWGSDLVRDLYRSLSGLVLDPPTLSSVRSASTSAIHTAANASYHLEQEYAKWADSQAPELRYSIPPVNAHAAVLALRGFTMRLLLHRPLVLAAIRQHMGIHSRATSPASGVHVPTLRSLELQQRNIAFGTSLAALIETAIGTVGLLEASKHDAVVLSAPWYQLFYGKGQYLGFADLTLCSHERFHVSSGYISTRLVAMGLLHPDASQ